MKTKIVTEVELDKIGHNHFLFVSPEEGEGFFASSDSDTLKEAAEFFDVPEKLLEAIDEAISFGLEILIEHLRRDLIDIWKQIEQLKE